MAGHSKWANIKHRKGAADAKRGKIFSKLAKEIMISARDSGGDPASNINFIENAWSSALDPMISPEDRAAGKLYNSRAIIDACRPFHWKEDFQKVNAPSPEARREAWDRWAHLRE